VEDLQNLSVKKVLSTVEKSCLQSLMLKRILSLFWWKICKILVLITIEASWLW